LSLVTSVTVTSQQLRDEVNFEGRRVCVDLAGQEAGWYLSRETAEIHAGQLTLSLRWHPGTCRQRCWLILKLIPQVRGQSIHPKFRITTGLRKTRVEREGPVTWSPFMNNLRFRQGVGSKWDHKYCHKDSPIKWGQQTLSDIFMHVYHNW
jgi:hypothetical protein